MKKTPGSLIVMSDLGLMVQWEDGEDPPTPGWTRLEPPVLSLQGRHIPVVRQDPSPDVLRHAAEPDDGQVVYLVVLLLQPWKQSIVKRFRPVEGGCNTYLIILLHLAGHHGDTPQWQCDIHPSLLSPAL